MVKYIISRVLLYAVEKGLLEVIFWQPFHFLHKAEGLMAIKDDIRERIRKINPKALNVIDIIDKAMRESNCDYDGGITLTENMTEEERKMQYYEYFIKKGYQPKEAEELTKKNFERDMSMLKQMARPA